MGIFDLFKPNIERMEKKKDVKGLIKALKHKDEFVRKKAAKALGKIRHARAVDPLIQTLKDEDWGVRHIAAVALDKLGWKPGNDACIEQGGKSSKNSTKENSL